MASIRIPQIPYAAVGYDPVGKYLMIHDVLAPLVANTVLINFSDLLGGIPAWRTDGNTITGTNILGTLSNDPINLYTNGNIKWSLSNATNGRWIKQSTDDILIAGGNDSMVNRRSVSVGFLSMLNVTVGMNNIGVGYNSMNQVTGGSFNVAVGSSALRELTTAQNNTAIGHGAMSGATGFPITGINNTAVGLQGLPKLRNGKDNIAIGSQPLSELTDGSYNIAIGIWTGFGITTGSYNILMGSGASAGLTTGSGNVSITPNDPVFQNGLEGTATENVLIGFAAGGEGISGNYNTVIGARSAPNISTGMPGAYNILLGYAVATLGVGASSNITIGNSLSAVNAAGSRQLNIGNVIYGNGVKDGSTAVSATPAPNSTVGLGVDMPTAQAHIAGSTTVRAAMRLEIGVAPTAPNDGDIWREDNTNTGLKIRVAGVTKTITLS